MGNKYLMNNQNDKNITNLSICNNLRASETMDKHNNENSFHQSSCLRDSINQELCVPRYVWTQASFTLGKSCREHVGSQLSGCSPSKTRQCRLTGRVPRRTTETLLLPMLFIPFLRRLGSGFWPGDGEVGGREPTVLGSWTDL